VVSYWAKVESDLELDMEVLDDLFSEATAISKLNPWLFYSEPFHRLRESGVAMKEVDLLNEIPLKADQIRNICILM
jgi:hypothetical protein